jgi:hypothetical protein
MIAFLVPHRPPADPPCMKRFSPLLVCHIIFCCRHRGRSFLGAEEPVF